MPILATLFMIAMLGSVGLPGLSGFVGEFLSIAGIYEVNPFMGIICAFGVVLGAIYMLKLYKIVIFGQVIYVGKMMYNFVSSGGICVNSSTITNNNNNLHRFPQMTQEYDALAQDASLPD